MAEREFPHASPEAREALTLARRARVSNEAIEPVADELHERLVVAMTHNHFADLFAELFGDPPKGRPIDLR